MEARFIRWNLVPEEEEEEEGEWQRQYRGTFSSQTSALMISCRFVVLQKEMQNPAKYRVEAPPSALAADESQIKVPALAFYANDITRVPASFLNVVPNLLAVCGLDRTDCCCWCVLLGLTGL